MSIFSMTGFASAQTPIAHQTSTVHLGIEMRSVNSRFLDLNFKMPDEFRVLEASLRESISSKIKRGKIDIRIFLDHPKGDLTAHVALDQLTQIQSLQHQIQQHFPQALGLSVADILKMSEPASLPIQDMQSHMSALCERVIQELSQARAREGERLAQALLERIQTLRGLVLRAEPMIPELVQTQRQKFLTRWSDALSQANQHQVPTEQAQERALSEAAAFAIRIDVAEELTRLNAHLDEIQNCLTANASGGVGKRLDFLIQELHRESNTLGSKSTTLEMSKISVDMKVLIEQMREQVQNIE